MRKIQITLSVCALLALAAEPAVGGATRPRSIEHPANVALIEAPNSWTYVHFPSNLRLYVSDKDPPSKSACNVGCDSAWPPLLAAPGEKPMGEWTIIVRDDGRTQWTYQSRPVYLRFHDSVEKPSGDGIDGVWHFLEP
jgi:predicted lipoprotein with Yx(FWY)xxD motif